MSSTFPSILTTYVNPNPTDKLNAPSHSGIEQNQNSGISQLEKVIGVEGATSIVGTLEYFIKSPASDGGGHVQGANKGGTGQTSYSKGDLLVASSSSVLSKLTVGSNGQAPIADSNAAVGISWQGVLTAPVIQNQTYTYAPGSVISTSVYGIQLAQPVSILQAGQAFAVKFPTTNTTSILALQVNATGPSSIAARIKNPDLSNPDVGSISASMIGILEHDGTNFQLLSRNALNPSTTYVNGTTTKNIGDGAGTQNIAHGLGKIPKKAKITAIVFSASNNFGSSQSIGVYNGTTNSCDWWNMVAPATGNGNKYGNDDTSGIVIVQSNNTANKYSAVITFTSTNIVLTWTTAGTLNSDTISLMWEAEG